MTGFALRLHRRAGVLAALAALPLIALAAPERAAAQQMITYAVTGCPTGPDGPEGCSTYSVTGYDRTGPDGVLYVNPSLPTLSGYAYISEASQSDDALEFATPTTTTTVTTDDATEIIAELNGKTISDTIYSGSLGGASAQGGVAAADAALRATGGPEIALGAPVLRSSTASTASTSSTLYSVAGVSVEAATSMIIGPTSLTAYEPDVASVAAPYMLDPNAGVVDSCGVSATSGPSSVRPSCGPVESVPLFVYAGQSVILVQTTDTYAIATTTTIADVTTDTSVYVIAATTPSAVPEPSTWAMLLAGLATLGLVAQGRRGRARAA